MKIFIQRTQSEIIYKHEVHSPQKYSNTNIWRRATNMKHNLLTHSPKEVPSTSTQFEGRYQQRHNPKEDTKSTKGTVQRKILTQKAQPKGKYQQTRHSPKEDTNTKGTAQRKIPTQKAQPKGKYQHKRQSPKEDTSTKGTA